VGFFEKKGISFCGANLIKLSSFFWVKNLPNFLYHKTDKKSLLRTTSDPKYKEIVHKRYTYALVPLHLHLDKFIDVQHSF
jgi:hypothetical protein